MRKKSETADAPTWEAVTEAEPVEAAPEPVRVSRRPAESVYTCTARQWVRIRKMRWEQTAGFLYEMRRKFAEGALNTREVWAAEFELFQNRHV